MLELRQQLERLGKITGLTQEEKGTPPLSHSLSLSLTDSAPDPEEFLNLLFKHTLLATPFISIQ